MNIFSRAELVSEDRPVPRCPSVPCPIPGLQPYFCNIEYGMDNWTVSDVNGHAGVIGQYLANAIISDKSK